MITGLNHITLSVSDLKKSFEFYTNVLRFTPAAKWETGVYLKAGDFWLCLIKDNKPQKVRREEYTHIAFTVSDEDFEYFTSFILAKNIPVWQENKSEGKSLYILDPDEHKLEIHSGDLKSRIEHLKKYPYKGFKLY